VGVVRPGVGGGLSAADRDLRIDRARECFISWKSIVIVDQVIRFFLSNFTLTFFLLGLIAAVLSLGFKKRNWTKGNIVEALLSWFLFFSFGISNLYNFVVHVFFGDIAAHFIGWENSPFQAEVGFASLGFAVVAFLAFKGSFDTRLAALIAPACFLWGAAIGHVVEMLQSHNFAPGNAGVIFYTDIFLPVIGLFLLWMQRNL
jgi:hypothetical protein